QWSGGGFGGPGSAVQHFVPHCARDIWDQSVRIGRLVGRDDRVAVGALGLGNSPGTTGRTAAQRVDSHLELGPGRKRLARPAVAHERTGAAAFEIPHYGLTALDLQQDEGVRAREL